MKLRTGFVSNSSSCSFCIYGIVTNEEELSTLVLPEIKKELNPEVKDEFDVWDFRGHVTKMSDLVFHFPDNSCCYVGRNYSSIGEDETGAQFKQSVKDQMAKFLNLDDLIFDTQTGD